MKLIIGAFVVGALGMIAGCCCCKPKCCVVNVVEEKCKCTYCPCSEGGECTCTKEKCQKAGCKCNKWKKD